MYLETYVKEVGFYRELQELVTIRTPTVYALEWEPTTHDFVVLMEDIRPARTGDQLRGADLRAAGLAIEQAVGLHAPTWGRVPSGAELEWLGGSRAADQTALRSQMFELSTPDFVDRYSSRLRRCDVDLAGPLTSAYPVWASAVADWAEQHGGWCLVHGDYRLDNLLFGEPPDSPALTVVDWQTVSIGIGPNDIAYYCGAGLLPDDRGPTSVRSSIGTPPDCSPVASRSPPTTCGRATCSGAPPDTSWPCLHRRSSNAPTVATRCLP